MIPEPIDAETNIRILREDDLPFANSVREIAGWNQTLTDWRRFFSLEPEGCFLAECDGFPAGTATTTCYGNGDLAWIGMVLVHPDFRRRGIGTTLLNHCIRHLRDERGICCVKLDATPEGRPLYEKLGFEAEWDLQRWVKRETHKGIQAPGRKGEWKSRHFELDRGVFGADRKRLLDSLNDGQLAGVASETGFGLVREGSRATYIGPVTAVGEKAGLELLSSLIESAQPGPEDLIFVDLPDPNEAATRLVAENGFEPVRRLTRMFLGENSHPGDPLRMFGIAEPALG